MAFQRIPKSITYLVEKRQEAENGVHKSRQLSRHLRMWQLGSIEIIKLQATLDARNRVCQTHFSLQLVGCGLAKYIENLETQTLVANSGMLAPFLPVEPRRPIRKLCTMRMDQGD